MRLVLLSMELGGAGFLAAVWAASAIWTARDASRRCGSVALRLGWTAAALVVPILGAGVYALARPCENRVEVRARRLRTRALEAILERDVDRCGCGTELDPAFRCCPGCGERLRRECTGCGGLVRATWAACPWCAKPLVEREPSGLPEVA